MKKMISMLVALTMVFSLSVTCFAADAITAEVQGTYNQSAEAQDVVIRINLPGVTEAYCGFYIDGAELPDGFVVKAYSTSNAAQAIGGGDYNKANGKLTYEESVQGLEDVIPADTYYELTLTAPADAQGNFTIVLKDVMVAKEYGATVLAEVASVTAQLTITGAGCAHSWNEATCTAPKTCSICGATEGEALGHSWNEATCTAPKTCSVCGATEGEALGHSWNEATCTTPKTCSVCGVTEGEALGHTWIPADYDHPKTCSVCGTTEGDPLGGVLLGDASGDGVINNVDAMLVLQAYAGLPGVEVSVAAGDVDGNGAVNNVDAMLILQHYAGIITEFPAA